MRSFFIFSILNQSYGIDIEQVQRILPAQVLTVVPDEDAHIEGMFQYEDEIIKVLSFRNITGLTQYSAELQDMFTDLKQQHTQWLESLISAVEENTKFTKTTDSHMCHLGKWLDSFQPETREMKSLVKNLNYHHKNLHKSAVEVLEMKEQDKTQAREWIDSNVKDMYKNTLSYLGEIAEKSEEVAVSFQRCLILIDADNNLFGVNVDGVENIIHIEDEKLHKPKEVQDIGKYMGLEAILEHEGKLITIVKDIHI